MWQISDENFVMQEMKSGMIWRKPTATMMAVRCTLSARIGMRSQHMMVGVTVMALYTRCKWGKNRIAKL